MENQPMMLLAREKKFLGHKDMCLILMRPNHMLLCYVDENQEELWYKEWLILEKTVPLSVSRFESYIAEKTKALAFESQENLLSLDGRNRVIRIDQSLCKFLPYQPQHDFGQGSSGSLVIHIGHHAYQFSHHDSDTNHFKMDYFKPKKI